MARLTGADRVREWVELDRLQTRLERQFQGGLARELRQESERALSRYRATRALPDTDPQHAGRILAILKQSYRASVELFGGRVLRAAKGAAPKHLKADGPDLWERLVSEYMMTRGAQKIADDIAQTTKNQIARLIQRGLEAGGSVDDIARSISGQIVAVTRLRASVIARTETHSASGFGSLGAAQETGLPMVKEWISARDERTRISHSTADQQTVPMNEPFEVDGEKLMYPGDPSGSAGNVINCRCQSGYILE